jgi:hypothetical protein
MFLAWVPAKSLRIAKIYRQGNGEMPEFSGSRLTE